LESTLEIALIMAQLQQQVYPFDIPSISDIHPGIPAHIIHTLHLDENIAISDPIDILNAKQAQGVTSSLAHLQGEYVRLTISICSDSVHNKCMSKLSQMKLLRWPRIMPLLSGPHISFKS